MDDRYESSDFQCDQLLDELMCEYVDGTMDPAVRKAFDELVNANPEIAEHIQGLCEAQHLLQCSRCHVQAPRQFQSRLRARLNAETGKIDVFGLTAAESRQSPARFLLLTLVLIWAGVALPQHGTVETAPPVSPISISELTFPRQQQALMTPATRIAASVPIMTRGEPLRIIRRQPRIQTAEAELALLAD